MPKLEYRIYQQEAENALFNYFYDGGKGNPLIVAPTGSGKSIMIAGVCKTIARKWVGQKVLIISHIKEILEQDAAKIAEFAPELDLGIYSAGLGSKRKGKDVTVAGIQSIYKKPWFFKDVDIIIVDECHLIPHHSKGMYKEFLSQMPCPVIGYTATPFRLSRGYLHVGDDAFFDEIVYTIDIKDLQKAGYLCKLSAKRTKAKMDASSIKKQAGDFIVKQLSDAFDRDKVTDSIVDELILYKDKRKSWLVFAIDIKHCEHMAEKLRTLGVSTAVIHSRMEGDRADIIQDFKDGKYQALVSVSVLTTGFDAPDVDLVALVRPTSSIVLHIQIIGRGLRISEKKEDCLILDFAGNLIRNGPIDNPVIVNKGKGGSGEAIMKACEGCEEILHAAVRVCPECGYEFKFKHNLSYNSGGDYPISKNIEAWHDIDEITYSEFTGKKGIPMMSVVYKCGLRMFKEFVCIEHGGYPSHKARHWWTRRSQLPAPESAAEAVKNAQTLNEPSRINVSENNRYPVIMEHDFSDRERS